MAWTLAGASVLLQGAAMASAQQEEGPILKPKPRAAATLLVMCDLACNWKLDGKAQGHIDTGGAAKAMVELGQHAVVAVSEDGLDTVDRDIEIKTVGQTIFRVELQEVRDSRLKAQQKADPVYLRAHAGENAKEGQRLYDQHDYVEAKPLLEMACNGGEMFSCITLGDIWEHHSPITFMSAYKILDTARSLYMKACDSGTMLGCTSAGFLYQSAPYDVWEPDLNKAYSLYQKACDGGDMWGCNNLAASYEYGGGVLKDHQRAIALYQKACLGGFAHACENLRNLQR
jgi:hypothetical protein